jgi:hypothetical protein
MLAQLVNHRGGHSLCNFVFAKLLQSIVAGAEEPDVLPSQL